VRIPDHARNNRRQWDPEDGLLFRGGELPHYRHALRGERSTSLFLHYVDESFSGTLE
jgi:hypothetical protein